MPRQPNEVYLAEIEPQTRQRLEALFAVCEPLGFGLQITSGWRDPAEQAALYARGRTAPGPKVTNAPPGSSFHEKRRAVDVYPKVGGKVPSDRVLQKTLWDRMGALAPAHGLTWGGTFTNIVDPETGEVGDKPHLENRHCLLHGGEHVGASAFGDDGSCRL